MDGTLQQINLINATSHQLELRWSNKGKQPSWTLNYTVFSFLLNGQNYVEYSGLQVMSQSRWNTIISIIGPHVDSLATKSCQQVRDQIIARGDKLSWKASFDGFYLTRGHHSNNSSATLHDISTDKIAWFTHRTKRGKGFHESQSKISMKISLQINILHENFSQNSHFSELQ